MVVLRSLESENGAELVGNRFPLQIETDRYILRAAEWTRESAGPLCLPSRFIFRKLISSDPGVRKIANIQMKQLSQTYILNKLQRSKLR